MGLLGLEGCRVLRFGVVGLRVKQPTGALLHFFGLKVALESNQPQ